MRAIWVETHGDTSALITGDKPTPKAGPGQVVVQVRACGLNHLDVWVRRGVQGHKFPLPLILGSDVAGIVAEVGAGIEHIKVGDEVIIAPGVSCGHCIACVSGQDHRCRSYGILGEHRHGGYAEAVCVPAINIFPKPQNLDFTQAATVGVAFITAWHMLVARAELQRGETVLIQAAGSGVGSAAVQIAKLWGADIIAVASSQEKLARAQALGAQHLINSSSQDIAKEVKKITQGKGVDVVFEHVGPATWEASMKSLAWQGRLVTCGATTGGDVSLNLRAVFFKSLSILGSTMGSKGEFATILRHVERGELTPVVDAVMPFSKVKEAHTRLENRQVFGKLVLVPD